ncbi:hypothetical protein [Pseudomonas donghuensis]|uniref:hypothetical protein n=1 Tax=Pseudomonas donghuensis TaxID=1163398 RepID=UPI000C2B00D4|nr:hypothetical protein [Pseudomonas donghuensis]PJY96200.1 hypothetical protein COO64_11390 [Pseudomonas donghuensis]WKY27561.1 hypothetical protein QYF67_22240 [Pseudomonas donghuensis]WSE82604.1 hypothetical protein VP780_22445 [Pseudomonas donghuensis]
MKIKIKIKIKISIKMKQVGPRFGVSLATPTSAFADTPVQALPVTSRLQEAERRCLEGAGA